MDEDSAAFFLHVRRERGSILLRPYGTGLIFRRKYQQRIRFFIAFLKEIVDKKGLSVKNNGIMQEKNEFIWKKLSLFHCFTVMKD